MRKEERMKQIALALGVKILGPKEFINKTVDKEEQRARTVIKREVLEYVACIYIKEVDLPKIINENIVEILDEESVGFRFQIKMEMVKPLCDLYQLGDELTREDVKEISYLIASLLKAKGYSVISNVWPDTNRDTDAAILIRKPA